MHSAWLRDCCLCILRTGCARRIVAAGTVSYTAAKFCIVRSPEHKHRARFHPAQKLKAWALMAQAERPSHPTGAGTTSTEMREVAAADEDKLFLALAAEPSVDDNIISNIRALRVLCERHGIDLLDGSQTPEELRGLTLASVLRSCAPLLHICVQVIQYDQMWPAGDDEIVSCPYVMASAARERVSESTPCVLQMTARAEAFLLRLVYNAWKCVLPESHVPSPTETVWWDVLAQYIRTGVCISNGWGVETTSHWKDAGVRGLYMDPESECGRRASALDEEWDATIRAARILAGHNASGWAHRCWEYSGALPPICRFASRTRGVLRHIRDVATADQLAQRPARREEYCAEMLMANGLRLQLSTRAMNEIVSYAKAAWISALPDSSTVGDDDWVWEEVARAYFKTGIRIAEGWGVRATDARAPPEE